MATVLDKLAQLLLETNRLVEAEPLTRRALSITEAAFGPEHPDVANILNTLATLLGATHRLVEAEPLHRRALAITEATFGPDHPRVALSLTNLAWMLHDTERHVEAEPLIRRALLIYLKNTRVAGHEHKYFHNTLYGYIGICEAMQVPEAEIRLRFFALCHEGGLDEARAQQILLAALPRP